MRYLSPRNMHRVSLPSHNGNTNHNHHSHFHHAHQQSNTRPFRTAVALLCAPLLLCILFLHDRSHSPGAAAWRAASALPAAAAAAATWPGPPTSPVRQTRALAAVDGGGAGGAPGGDSAAAPVSVNVAAHDGAAAAAAPTTKTLDVSGSASSADSSASSSTASAPAVAAPAATERQQQPPPAPPQPAPAAVAAVAPGAGAATRTTTAETARAAAPKRPLAQRAMASCRPARSFIMLFMGHSGSSAVISELNSHSRVHVDVPEAVDHDELEHNTTAALSFAREFFRKAIGEGRVPGFKMRPKHIRADPAGWAALAREFDTRIIWNRRLNIVKMAVGEYSYKKLRDASVVEGLRSEAEVKARCSKGVGCTFRIDDMKFFHHTLTDVLHGDNMVAWATHLISTAGVSDATPARDRVCVTELVYEDYLYDRAAAMRTLLAALGLPHEATQPTRFKATKDNMCEVVENWAAVCRNFYGCRVWRGMMDDEVNGCRCEQAGGPLDFCETTYAG